MGATVTTQRDKVLKLLQDRGDLGVSAHSLVYSEGITRGAAIIFELRESGLDIETLDEGTLPDGRKRLARYVLHRHAPSAVPPVRPAMLMVTNAIDTPEQIAAQWVQTALPLPCGCVRAADGKSWETRCQKHK